jgi:hypothetical protein
MLLAQSEHEPRRKHLIRYYHWWNDPDHAGAIDEMWPDYQTTISNNQRVKVAEGTIFWPEGGETMRPQQLLNTMRDRTLQLQMGPDVSYSHLDSLRDSSPMKVVRSKHSLVHTAKRLHNCAAGYHDRILARNCVFVVMENEAGKPIALGKADLRRGRAAPIWGEIKETCNRRASAEIRSTFSGFLPSIVRWYASKSLSETCNDEKPENGEHSVTGR